MARKPDVEEKVSDSEPNRRSQEDNNSYRPKKRVETERKRGDYFKYHRRERIILSFIGRVVYNPFVTKEYRAIRIIYYRILPVLFTRLEYDQDRWILFNIEDKYRSLLNIGRWYRSTPGVATKLRPEVIYLHSSGDPLHGSQTGTSSSEPTSTDATGQLRHPRGSPQSSVERSW